MSSKDSKCAYVDEDLVISIDSVKMWGSMVIEKHFDNNAVESGNFRHVPALFSIEERYLPDSCE